MKMLRQWNGDSLKPIIEMLEQFSISSTNLRLLKYENLSPDSFIWLFSTKGKRFCLYAEDFVPTLQHVCEAMNKHGALITESDTYTLMPVKKAQDWASASPVVSADMYPAPQKPEEFMKYAATSGYDFAFLGESENN